MKSAKEAIIKFRDARDWKQFHTPENLAKSISIEAGELLECFQWESVIIIETRSLEELADVVNYCILLR
jgi:dCTP diphosphatase